MIHSNHVIRYLFILLILVFCTQLTSVAGDSLRLIRSIPVKARLLSSDPVGNLYVVKDNNILLRYNSKGDSIGIFNEIKKGHITHIDATNPLRILLFLGDYNQVIALNNMLSQRYSLSLRSTGLLNVSCVANSADGRIWLYDPVAAVLMKVDDQLKVIQTTDLRAVSQNPNYPADMTEFDRNLFIADSVQGIMQFDQFGFYRTTFPINTRSIQLFNQYLVYYSPPFLHSYHMPSFREKVMTLPEPGNILQVRVERNALSVLRNDRLDLYEMPDP